MANLVQVVMGICLLTVAFALLIWYGMYDNPIDSVKMAQVSTFLSNFLITSNFSPISACASDFLAYHMLRVACGIPMLKWRLLMCVTEGCYAPPCMHRLVLFLIISHMHEFEKKSVIFALGLVCTQSSSIYLCNFDFEVDTSGRIVPFCFSCCMYQSYYLIWFALLILRIIGALTKSNKCFYRCTQTSLH